MLLKTWLWLTQFGVRISQKRTRVSKLQFSYWKELLKTSHTKQNVLDWTAVTKDSIAGESTKYTQANKRRAVKWVHLKEPGDLSPISSSPTCLHLNRLFRLCASVSWTLEQGQVAWYGLQIKARNSHAVSRLTSEGTKCAASITGIKFRDDSEFHYEHHIVIWIKFYLLHKLLFHLVDWYQRHLKHWPKIHIVYLATDL